MQKNLIISLITGQLIALLPLWDWGDKLTFLTGSICITIVAMIAITWLEDRTRAIKRALTSANVKGLSNTRSLNTMNIMTLKEKLNRDTMKLKRF